MIDFNIYDKIDGQYKLDRNMLNKELLIKTVVPKIENSDNVISKIYDHCFWQAYYYSWSYKRKVTPYYNDLKVNDWEKDYEEAIKNHCIVVALYTVQYLKYNDIVISAPQLGSRAKGMGHNTIKSLSNIEIDNYELTFDKSEDRSLTDRDANDIINKNLKKIIKYREENELGYMEKTLNIVPTSDKHKISLFLSNFSYKVLINLNKFNIYKSLNNIYNASKGNSRNNSIRKFIDDYTDYDDKIYFRKEDEDKNKDTNTDTETEDEVYYYETTEIDRILFYYKKERLLHSDFIKYCFNTKSDVNGLVFAENIKEDILNLCFMLPNVYSRNIFAEFFKQLLYDEDGYDRAVDYLNDLLYITFPIFEKSFFISLYEYCKENHQDKETLDLMNEYLTDYVIKEIYNKDIEKYTEKSLKKSKILTNYTNVKGTLINNERCSRILSLLEFAFNTENINRTNIRNKYKRPKVNIPNFGKIFDNKSKLNYLKEAIYRDYHFYLNLHDDYDATYAYKRNYSQQMIDEILQEHRKYLDII